MKQATAASFFTALLCLCPHAARAQEDEPALRRLERRIAALEDENEVLRRKILWLEELRHGEPAPSSGVAIVRAPLDPGTRLSEVVPERLKQIRLPDGATKDQVRRYVARILASAGNRGVYSTKDPEVAFLERVGPHNVDVLIEPLMYVPSLDRGMYLIAALKTLVEEEHKQMIIDALARARDLVEAVAARGWTGDPPCQGTVRRIATGV